MHTYQNPHAAVPPTLEFYAEGRLLTRSDVLGWERRRSATAIAKYKAYLGKKVSESVAAKAGCPLEPTSLADQRRVLAALKAHVTQDRVADMFLRELAVSASVSRAGIALSRGRRSLSSVEMVVDNGTAQGFVDWFLASHDANDEPTMLAANPDHHRITRLPDGRQDVIETTGGSPLPSHFLVTFGDIDGLAIGEDARYPVRFGGRCYLPNGTEVGAALHQFRDEAVGFSAKLGIEFPAILPRRMIVGHHWHLACEFSNWVESYLNSQSARPQEARQS